MGAGAVIVHLSYTDGNTTFWFAILFYLLQSSIINKRLFYLFMLAYDSLHDILLAFKASVPMTLFDTNDHFLHGRQDKCFIVLHWNSSLVLLPYTYTRLFKD